jgi:hypothetical protein
MGPVARDQRHTVEIGEVETSQSPHCEPLNRNWRTITDALHFKREVSCISAGERIPHGVQILQARLSRCEQHRIRTFTQIIQNKSARQRVPPLRPQDPAPQYHREIPGLYPSEAVVPLQNLTLVTFPVRIRLYECRREDTTTRFTIPCQHSHRGVSNTG